MGRHSARGPDPRYSSPIRIQVETRYGVGWARALFAVSCAGAAAIGAILALTVYAGWNTTESWREDTRITVVPNTQPTSSYDGRGFVAPDKDSLIIQQNPSCWLGVPGATCGSERTFLGER